jgi:AcrR family transcriptional regulator
MPTDTWFRLDKRKQRRIRNAALRVYAAHDYRHTTIDRIVEEARIPKGSFYQYFTNKDDLFVHLFVHLGEDKKEALLAWIDQAPNLPFARFLVALETEGQRLEVALSPHPELRQRFYMECPQEVIQSTMTSLVPHTYEVFTKAIQRYQNAGVIRRDIDPLEASYIIASCLFQVHLLPLGDQDLNTALERMLAHATQYLLVDPDVDR